MRHGELERYSRHILLPEIDEAGQERLLRARALVIGLGGLGSPAAIYLAAAGLGHLELSDPDRVELTNLQRQILHRTPDLGRPKTDSARDHLHALNPDVQVTTHPRLEDAHLAGAVGRADVVLDCSDNFHTRYTINKYCVAAATPLVSGAAAGWQGQVTVIDSARGTGCYRCVYPDAAAPEAGNCNALGVFAPLTGIVGAVQAAEAIKILLNIGQTLAGRLLRVDARDMRWRESRLTRDPACPVCGPDNLATGG